MNASKIAKVTHPTLTGVLPRKRLFTLLDRMRKRPVIWVSGPPGCGKTALVSSYLDARSLPFLWFQIDQNDSDPATFFYYLGQAAKKAVRRQKKSLPLFTSEYSQDLQTFTRRYFEDFFSGLNPSKRGAMGNLAKKGKGGFVLVFDNYQEVPDRAPLHEVLLNGLASIPEKVIVILISRSQPPPSFIRLRANYQMEILGWKELRLTLEESEGIIRLRAGQKQPKNTISILHKASDGWAAGLVLMLESVQREVIAPQALGKFTPEEILDYFGNELFDRTDKQIQEFFLKTAFLPKMTVKMAVELTDLPQAGRILDTLSRNNYFIEKRFHTEPVYQYHLLFREFLLTRARKELSRETQSYLIRRAAPLLEESGETEAAVALLCDAKDWEGMTQLFLKHAPSMWEQGRIRLLTEWLDYIPKEILENHSWLLYWGGLSRFSFNPMLGQPYFEKAFERFKTEEDSAGVFLAWSAIVDSITLGFEDFKPLDHWILVFEELKHHFKDFPSEEVEVRVVYSMLTAMLYRQPQHPEIEVWRDRAFALAEASSSLTQKIRTLSRLAQYLIYMGDFQKIEPIVSSLQNVAQTKNALPLALVSAKFGEAFYYNHSGFHEKCVQCVYEALELSRASGMNSVDHALLGQGVSSALMANDLSTAGKFLKEMASSLRVLKPWMKCLYHLLRAREALLRENPSEASLHAELSLKMSTEVGSPLSSLYCHLAKAHVNHQLGNKEAEVEHLAFASGIAQGIKSKIFEFWVSLAEALFALDQGQEASAQSLLQKALSIGKEERYLETFIDQPSSMVKLCGTALRAGIEVGYVQELIRKRNLIPDKPLLHLENWPWPLKIYTMGKFEIYKEGKPIRFSRKVQEKPLQMLKALIAMGGTEVGEDLIADIIWPEAEGDLSQQSFSTTLHRLRQLLGHEKVIQRQEGRLILDRRLCWVDIWAFEDLLRGAEVQWKKGEKKAAIHQMEKAMEIYTGPFLSREADQPWAVSTNERLRNKFLRTVEKLGDYWEKAGQWEKALDFYQRGLEADDLAEEFYRRLMICYERLDRRAEALAVYLRCQKVLTARLGIEPSLTTQNLYKSFKS